MGPFNYYVTLGGVGRVWHFVTGGGGRAERYVTPKKKFYMYNIIL